MSSIQDEPRSDDSPQVIADDKIVPDDILDSPLSDNSLSKPPPQHPLPKYHGNTRSNVARRYVIFERWNKSLDINLPQFDRNSIGPLRTPQLSLDSRQTDED